MRIVIFMRTWSAKISSRFLQICCRPVATCANHHGTGYYLELQSRGGECRPQQAVSSTGARYTIQAKTICLALSRSTATGGDLASPRNSKNYTYARAIDLTIFFFSLLLKVRRCSRFSKNVNLSASRHSCKDCGFVSVLLRNVLLDAAVENGTAHATTFHEILGSRVVILIFLV